MNSLFPDIPVSKSPRLLWMERHDIELDDPRPFSPEPHRAFILHDKGLAGVGITSLTLAGLREHAFHAGYGDTEDDALTALAKAAGLKLWNEEEIA